MSKEHTEASLKLKAIQKIKESDSFSEQELFIQILDYLAKAEQEDKIIKSTTLAIDILGNEDHRDVSVQDVFIRNKVMNLRKKLNLYYLTEGKEEEHRISIPKGTYKIKITSVEVQSKDKGIAQQNDSKKNKVNLLLTVGLAFFFLSSLFLLGMLLYGHSSPSKTSLVSFFLDRKKPLDIVVGSRGFYKEFDQKIRRFRLIYDVDVELPTQEKKMKALITMNPKRRIASMEDNFRHADIPNLFFAAELHKEWGESKSTSLLKESFFYKNTSTIEQNTVFISKVGSGDLYRFYTFFEKTNCIFKKGILNTPKFISHFALNEKTSISFTYDGLYNTPQYFLIKKVIAPNGHGVLFLLGSGDKPRDYVLSRMYNEVFQEKIIQSFSDPNKLPEEFELLIEIKNNTQATIIYNSSVSSMVIE